MYCSCAVGGSVVYAVHEEALWGGSGIGMAEDQRSAEHRLNALVFVLQVEAVGGVCHEGVVFTHATMGFNSKAPFTVVTEGHVMGYEVRNSAPTPIGPALTCRGCRWSAQLSEMPGAMRSWLWRMIW